ncbi:unnamed protein product [Coregonus sp. 'balchen']|nr:unnamed protein product [Coregonus sp. 'balchen']
MQSCIQKGEPCVPVGPRSRGGACEGDAQRCEGAARKPVVENYAEIDHNTTAQVLVQKSPPRRFKWGKADILEMTVFLLRQQQKSQPVSCLSLLSSVMSDPGVSKIYALLSKDEVKTQSQRRLLSHFQSLQPSSDKNRRESDLPQLSSPAHTAQQREQSSQQRSLEALVRVLQTGAPL